MITVGSFIKLTETGKRAYDKGLGSQYNLRQRSVYGIISHINNEARIHYFATFYDIEDKIIAKNVTLMEYWCEPYNCVEKAMKDIEEGLLKLEQKLTI